MKKRILFTMPSMFIGGAERSLLGLLDAIDYKKYDVELFLYRHEGEFLEFINPKVTIIPEINKYKTFDVTIVSLIFIWHFEDYKQNIFKITLFTV